MHITNSATSALRAAGANLFLRYNERRFYRMEWARIGACLPVMHQLRHVAEQIRQTGPTGESNQFPAERFNGHTSSNCKSRVAANVNIANNGLLDEHANNLS